MEDTKRLGRRLVEAGVLTQQALDDALRAQQVTGERLGEVLLRLRHASEEDVMRALCEEAGIPFLSLEGVAPDPTAIDLVPEDLARAKAVLPLRLEGSRLTVVLPNPFDVTAVIHLEQATGRLVSVHCAPRAEIMGAIERAYAGHEASRVTARPGTSNGSASYASSAPVVVERSEEDFGTAAQVVDDLIREAVEVGATDIHIEPTLGGVEIRFRIDGVLRPHGSFPKTVQGALLSRIKVVSGLDIAETRLPQDGRLRRTVSGRQIDLRISTFPTLHGEDLVLRVLDRERVPLRLESLGMPADDVKLFRTVIRRPHGIVLITGPTGSGKTTTLYAALSELNRGDRAIVTLEDPIEYELPGIRQSQINLRAGLTFASGLRSLLRHDPDVILVGEMRDRETVQIGLSAALTGHLVLTTLHTSSAASAVARLRDLGAEAFVLASSVQLIMAQRLVRVLCTECKQPAEVPENVRRRFNLMDITLYRGKGCSACHGTGYRGRLGIFELIAGSQELARCIYENVPAEEIQRRCGRRTLLQDGLTKVRDGVTSLEELVRQTALM